MQCPFEETRGSQWIEAVPDRTVRQLETGGRQEAGHAKHSLSDGAYAGPEMQSTRVPAVFGM